MNCNAKLVGNHFITSIVSPAITVATTLLFLGLMWLTIISIAKSSQIDPHHQYDYVEMIRRFPRPNRGKSELDPSMTQQPATIQKYWQNFVRSIPFRFNMTNFFNAGTQQLLETPVGAHHEITEPNRRRRKQSKRKNNTMKKHKESKKPNYRHYTSSDHNRRAQTNNQGYHQLQLQALGMDANHVMHFFDPSTGSYYALQLISSPQQYYHKRPLFLPHDDEDYLQVGDSDSDGEEHDENVEAVDDYSDDIEIAGDNWGYSDEDIFGERKLKTRPFNFKIFPGERDEPQDAVDDKLSSSFVSIHRDLLKPETEEDVKLLLNNNDKPMERTLEDYPETMDVADRRSSRRRIKPKSHNKTPEDMETEMVRNILGSFMSDDAINRRRQSTISKPLKSKHLVEQPRKRRLYFIYPRRH
ncbi:uncharacterized protein LOC142234098 [Haematobia irritans]|uniref:uncharacterized protein LOC142234098 n=1 Tax=Haematobia irritans TaxID=7368 RepID=UPI003F505471